MATMEDHPVRTLPRHTNLIEDPMTYLIELDVSDFARSDLAVTVHGRFLTIVGEHTTATNERPFSVHERLEESFSLPDDVLRDQVEAIFKRGTLEIRAPRYTPSDGEWHVPIRGAANWAINPDATPC